MASIQMPLAQALPKPKHSSEEQESSPFPPSSSIVSHAQLAQLKVPSYGQRQGWRPRSDMDFLDGGAYPEIPVAQYPLQMGSERKQSNALALQVDSAGKIKYADISRRGHAENRIVHSSFQDLIPLRERASAGDVSLSRPSQDDIDATTERTRAALSALATAAGQSKKTSKRDATFVRYTPSNPSQNHHRLFKIVERQTDPVEPPKHKFKKIPRGPPSPPPPLLRSPPRKLTAQDQEDWKIPPPVSNWKNPKGFTVPLDKRLAADGRSLQDVAINDKFAQFSEALFVADRHAREEVKQRSAMQQKLAQKEKAQKEESLRMLAQKAREERARAPDESGSSASESDDLEHERIRARQERRRAEERKLRQSRMGAERKMQALAREQGRDISEKIALGMAQPTQSSAYDERLFNQSGGFDAGYNEDQPYDKPLFAVREAIDSIYRPRLDLENEDRDVGDSEMARIQKETRFGTALGMGTLNGSADAESRSGPIQFEKDVADPFHIDGFLSEVESNTRAKRRYGLQEEEPRAAKRFQASPDED